MGEKLVLLVCLHLSVMNKLPNPECSGTSAPSSNTTVVFGCARCRPLIAAGATVMPSILEYESESDEVKKTTVEFTMMHTALRAGRALVATRNAAWKRVAWHGDGRCGESFYLPMQEWCCTSQTTHPSFPLSLPLYTCNKNEHCCTAFFPPSTCLFLPSVAKTSVAAVLLDFSLLPLNSPTRGAL